MSEKLFETAVRTKMRFPFRGLVSVEDLYDLSVENLDTVFKTLNSQVKRVKEESLLDRQTQEDKVLAMQIEIVKHIVKVKLEEQELRLKAQEQKAKQQKILAVLSSKQDEALQNKSIEELTKMLDELER
jgi:N-acetylmuramic acid 6-phosphate (MurNAc-6-P) etherase